MIEFVLGDLAVEEVDAVILPANPDLLPGGGASGALHRAGGPEIAAECALLGGCPTGDAKATTADRLPARRFVFLDDDLRRTFAAAAEALGRPSS